jgi:ABC-2 type transport system permease protein
MSKSIPSAKKTVAPTSAKKAARWRRFKYGGYAIAVMLAVLALVILANVGLTLLEDKYNLRADMSQNKKYTLTPKTEQIVEGLQKDIYIYPLYAPGSSDPQVEELLRRYKVLSPHVITQIKDPNKEPLFMQQFTAQGGAIAEGSIIVTDAGKKFFRVLSQSDLYQAEYNDSANPYTPTGFRIVAESALTQAINYVSSGFLPTIYVVQGHGELSLATIYGAKSLIEKENYQMKAIDLTKEADAAKAGMQEGDILMFIAPATDLTDSEYALLKPFMKKGGRFYFMFDPSKMSGKSLPNFEALLKLYDIKLKQGLVYETNSQYLYDKDKPLMIVPTIESHAITSTILSSAMQFFVIVDHSGALQLPDMAPDSTMTITSLLKTSAGSYLKASASGSSAKEEGDAQGPFTLMAAGENQNSNDVVDSARFIVTYGSTDYLTGSIDPSNPTLYQLTNITLLEFGSAWMRNAEKDIFIPGKTMSASTLGFKNTLQQQIVIVLSCFVIPVLLFVGGIVVYRRRKHL